MHLRHWSVVVTLLAIVNTNYSGVVPGIRNEEHVLGKNETALAAG